MHATLHCECACALSWREIAGRIAKTIMQMEHHSPYSSASHSVPMLTVGMLQSSVVCNLLLDEALQILHLFGTAHKEGHPLMNLLRTYIEDTLLPC